MNCTVPAGKPILATILVGLNDYPCPDTAFEPAPGQSLEAFLSEFNASMMDTVTLGEATLDGRPLRVWRVRTGVFPFTARADQVGVRHLLHRFPATRPGRRLRALIEPLPRGSHVLRLRGAIPVFNDGEPFEDTYLLKVEGAGPH